MCSVAASDVDMQRLDDMGVVHSQAVAEVVSVMIILQHGRA